MSWLKLALEYGMLYLVIAWAVLVGGFVVVDTVLAISWILWYRLRGKEPPPRTGIWSRYD